MEKDKGTTGSIDLFAAIEEMKRISEAGGTFSMKFRKWNRQSGEGGDMAIIRAARVRPKAKDEAVAHSSFKLYFTDTETGRPLNCWQPLIMEFNGRPTVLN